MTHQKALRQAHKLGIKNVSHTDSKTTIIRTIQEFKGMPICFAGPDSEACKDTKCEWRSDCQNKLTASWASK